MIGYGLGASQILSPATLLAQGDAKKAATTAPAASSDLTEDTKNKIRAAAESLKAARDALVDEGKYVAATKGVNAFAVLTGGCNAVRDLENGAIVDPETFAALYADLGTDAVAAELGHDAENRLTYKGKVIRMFPVSALRGRYATRGDLTGDESLTGPKPDATTTPAKR
jgi:hypothetical protein